MISVVIPTRNRADSLAGALESIARQTLGQQHFEMLVIDNGSRDPTPETVHAFSGKLENLRYFYEPQVGLHSGRHRGMLEADGDVLVFADDDIEAFPTWLEAISHNFEDADVAMVGGNVLPKFASTPPRWVEDMWESEGDSKRTLGYLSLIDFGEGKFITNPHRIWGCNFAIRKNVLLAAGGFHPDGFPRELLKYRGDGETHVSQHVIDCGLKAIFDSRASIYHVIPSERLTVRYFCDRYFAQGISFSYGMTRGSARLITTASAPFLAAKYGKGLARSLVAPLIGPRRSSYSELAGILLRLQLAHFRGLLFHQQQARKDPELLAWILKDSYFPSQTAQPSEAAR